MQNNGFCTVKEPVLEGKTGSFALPKRLHQKDAERPTLPIMPNIPMSSYNPCPTKHLACRLSLLPLPPATPVFPCSPR